MPPFEPASWVSLGVTMPGRPVSEVPSGASAYYQEYLYVGYAGEYQNVGGLPYTQQTNVKVGSIWRTQDGVAWSLAWEGNAPMGGYPRWQPVSFFQIGATLFCLILAGGSNYFVNNAYQPPGALGLIKTTNGTTWSLVTLFYEWPESSFGGNSPAGPRTWNPALSLCAWPARASGPAGEDAWWVAAGWDVGTSGTTGSFSDSGTDAFRSIDGGLTWTFVRHMRGTYPFVTGVSGPGPSVVLPARRLDQPGYPERWFMLGGSGTLNYSDDQGGLWTPSSFFGQMPANPFVLRNNGVTLYCHGSGSAAPDVKISCDFGASFTVVAGGPGFAPANAFMSPVQFNGIEEMLLAVRDNVDSTTKTALWYTTDGGETLTKLGTLPTAFIVPYWLAWYPDGPLLILFTRDGAVWVCEDAPDGVATPRAVCPNLFEIPEAPPPLPPVPPSPIQSGVSRISLRVTAAWRPR